MADTKKQEKASSFKPNEGEEGLVHYYLTVTNATPPSDPEERSKWQFPRELKKVLPITFVKAFRMHFMANDRFGNISKPEEILSIMKNLDKDTFKDRYEDVIDGWRKTIKGGALNQRIEQEFKSFLRPRLAGSPQMIMSAEDIVYIPKDKNYNGEEILKALPENL